MKLAGRPRSPRVYRWAKTCDCGGVDNGLRTGEHQGSSPGRYGSVRGCRRGRNFTDAEGAGNVELVSARPAWKAAGAYASPASPRAAPLACPAVGPALCWQGNAVWHYTSMQFHAVPRQQLGSKSTQPGRNGGRKVGVGSWGLPFGGLLDFHRTEG